MQILWLAGRDFNDYRAGGAERTIEEVGKRLARNGHEVHVLTGSKSPERTHALPDGMSVYCAGSFIRAHLMAPVFLGNFPREAIVVDDLAHVVPWLSNRLSSHPVTPFFHHLHRRTLPGQVSQGVARILSKIESTYSALYSGEPWLTESVSSESDLIRLGVPPETITRIPPGVDSNHFRPETKSEEPTIVYFAGLKRYKRPDHAIIAIARLRQRGVNACLKVIGDGPCLLTLKSLTRELNLSDSVEFLGRISWEELPRIVGSAWANVYCSVAEGWGLSAIEAAASGVPTVGYAVPGLTEGIINESTGILVPDGDIDGLARALERVLSSPGGWSRPCQDWARTLSWEKAAQGWEKHLQLVGDIR